MINKLNFIFVGGVFPKDEEKEILRKSKRRPQMAANNYQWCLIDGLDRNLSEPVTILNRKYIGSFPKSYKDMIIRGRFFSHTKGADDIDLGFVNISVLRNIIPPFHEKKFIRKFLKSDRKNIFFFYSIGNRNLRIAEYIKRKSPESIVAFYIPDLPQYVMLSVRQSAFVKMHRHFLSNKVKNTLKISDINVLITQHQAEQLCVDLDKCLVVEGFASLGDKAFTPIVSNQEFNIVYAGTLAKQYDILDLVYAFQKVDDPRARLQICGDGDAVNEIREAEKRDNRIKYLGIMNQEELADLYCKASLLVNPRKKGKGFTLYSFPSKTIDYMLAGRPVLCQQLEGIPSEYDDYLIYFSNEGDSNNTLEGKIAQIMGYSLDELNEIGKRNFDFIANQKNSRMQAKKILDFIRKKHPELES